MLVIALHKLSSVTVSPWRSHKIPRKMMSIDWWCPLMSRNLIVRIQGRALRSSNLIAWIPGKVYTYIHIKRGIVRISGKYWGIKRISSVSLGKLLTWSKLLSRIPVKVLRWKYVSSHSRENIEMLKSQSSNSREVQRGANIPQWQCPNVIPQIPGKNIDVL